MQNSFRIKVVFCPSPLRRVYLRILRAFKIVPAWLIFSVDFKASGFGAYEKGVFIQKGPISILSENQPIVDLLTEITDCPSKITSYTMDFVNINFYDIIDLQFYFTHKDDHGNTILQRPRSESTYPGGKSGHQFGDVLLNSSTKMYVRGIKKRCVLFFRFFTSPDKVPKTD